VAEGAESATQVELLRQMGCSFAQGYFFSRPMDETAATALLSTAA
jgi:EAL domain-containing protein (putative c-di-GMP-specific phosphodiesterase class I)